MDLRLNRHRLTLAIAWCSLSASAAHGQVDGAHLTVSPFAGMVRWSERAELEPATFLGARGSLVPWRHLAFEATYGVALTEATAAPQVDARVIAYGADIVFHVLPGRRVNPYAAAGWSQLEFDPGAGDTESLDGWEAGGGLEARMSSRLSLRLDLRDVLVRRAIAPTGARDYDHNLFVSAGLHVAIRGRTRDNGDNHRARENDRINQNLKRTYVTRLDSDLDLVPDVADSCAGTPRGASVDTRGCPLDSDSDGVYDGLDVCIRTPADVRVDPFGCPVEVLEKQIQLLDSGSICLNDVLFERSRVEIQPESYRAIHEIGLILVEWPELRIEIGGHTDDRGEKWDNLALSKRRARAILDYLLRAFPRLDESRFVVVGYGETQSLAPNDSEIGRGMNRRVEFKVLNREVLKKELESRRHFLGKSDG